MNLTLLEKYKEVIELIDAEIIQMINCSNIFLGNLYRIKGFNLY